MAKKPMTPKDKKAIKGKGNMPAFMKGAMKPMKTKGNARGK